MHISPIPIISAKNLAIIRGDKLLFGLATFDIYPKEQILIAGSSGSGKTSLAMAIAGMLYYSGMIDIDAEFNRIKFIQQVYAFRDKSGMHDFYYQQRYNSYDADNFITVLDVLKEHKNFSQADDYLKILNLNHKLNAPLIQLSSGERKKIGIIQALLDEPKIILIDNPYLGLDVIAVDRLNSLFTSLSKQGILLIIIANLSEMPKFITHVINIQDDKTIRKVEPNSVDSTKINMSRNKILVSSEAVTFPYTQIVEFKNVTVRYGEKIALANINWRVDKGDKYLVSGHNGAGKSTLLSLISGDHPQSYANEIYLFDKKRGSGESIWEIKQKISFVSPEFHCCFDLSTTCLNAVISGFFDTSGLYTTPTKEQIDIGLNWLQKFSMLHYQNQRLITLSLGLQRIILLIRALVKNPPLLIFDEPCQGLDDIQAGQFIDLIDDLFADTEHTIIYVSHRLSQIPRCINKTLQLENVHQDCVI